MTTTLTPVISVKAVRWEKGWDLILDEDNATSVAKLHDATQQVRDYLDTIDPDTDHVDTVIDIAVDLDGVQDEIGHAQQIAREAAQQQEHAAAEIRRIARTLKARKIPTDDIATLLKISKSRTYQLLSHS